MLTEEQIREAMRPLCKDDTALKMLIETSMDEYRAIEQAVRKEMESDRRDAERWRFAVAPGLEQSMMWLDVFEDWDGNDDFADAIDTARGQTDQSPQAHQPLKTPWDDFAGNPIHEGDTIRHPADGSEGVVFVDHSMLDSAKWRVRYHGLGGSSSLVLQIGDKGQAVVVKKASKGQT